METRSIQSRFEQNEEQIQHLQADVTEIKLALQSLEVDRVESGEFRKVMLGWMKQQGKTYDSGGSMGAGEHSTGIFTNSGGGGSGSPGGGFTPSNGSEGWPWAVKKVKLPEFYGFDPQGWIKKAKLYFDINGTPPHLRLRLAQLSMTGVAQHWFTIVTEIHENISWEQFQEELLQRFSGLEIQNPYEQLATIKQSSSIYDYIDDFEYLLSLVPKLPESQALGYFVAGLRDEVKKWV